MSQSATTKQAENLFLINNQDGLSFDASYNSEDSKNSTTIY
jgi:hypothetical protein